MRLFGDFMRAKPLAIALVLSSVGSAATAQDAIVRYTFSGEVTQLLSGGHPEVPGVLVDGASSLSIDCLDVAPDLTSSSSLADWSQWENRIVRAAVEVATTSGTVSIDFVPTTSSNNIKMFEIGFDEGISFHMRKPSSDVNIQAHFNANGQPTLFDSVDALPRDLDIGLLSKHNMLFTDQTTGAIGFEVVFDTIAIEVNPDTDTDTDTDEDGLLDSVELDLAQNGGLPCLSPVVFDSDGDGLSDGVEVLVLLTNPCDVDTDGDNIPDDVDPAPLDPDGNQVVIEEDLRDLARDVEDLPLDRFTGKGNSAQGRRGALANQLQAAAKQVGKGNAQGAIGHLMSILEKIDDEPSPEDWITADGEDDGTKANLRASIELQLLILSYLV